MAIELELKFRLDDPTPVRQRLHELHAPADGGVVENNHLFDTPDGRLRQAGCGLRVRTATPMTTPGAASARLTFKGPRAAGELKCREELELGIDDADTLVTLLGRLGFHEVVAYEKRRETYRLGDCEVTLDELPRLGWWLEIEGPDAARIGAVRTQLGLADVPPVPQTYVELTAAHGEADAGGVRRLRFPRD